MGQPDPALVARFAVDLAALTGSDGQLLLAVSGGPDSLAMLLLAHAACPDRIACATVDHGLRSEGTAEAAAVGTLCANLGVDHATLLPSRKLTGKTGNIQARARHARYDALARHAVKIGSSSIMTAHHADDQAETFLMRAARGAGVPGLSGVRATGDFQLHDWHSGYPKGGVVAVADVRSVGILRPLLGWRRAELRQIVLRSEFRFVDDPSNNDERFDRTRFRTLLAENDWIDAARIASAAAYVADANETLDAMMAWFSRARTLESNMGEVRMDVADLPREIARRLARQAIGRVRLDMGIVTPAWKEGENIEPMLDALDAGGGATRAGVQASAKGSVWHFREAPPRRSH